MEQSLIEDLIVESIGIYGHGIYYCPRTINKKDDIYGEDILSSYDSAFNFDMYIRSYDSYEGDGTFLSKFNLEIRDQITFTVARRTFMNEIGNEILVERPREGDLIYSPMVKRIFIIKYVNNSPVFYQMGTLQTWDLVCETFEYSSERFNTGIPEIDEIERKYTNSMESSSILTNDEYSITDESGFNIVLSQFNFETQNQDTYADNDEFEAEGVGILDWSQRDPFSEDIST